MGGGTGDARKRGRIDLVLVFKDSCDQEERLTVILKGSLALIVVIPVILVPLKILAKTGVVVAAPEVTGV